jgi:hypothetical protein
MKPSSKPPLPRAARLRNQRLLTRLVMLAVLALSLWLLWWSVVVRLAPVNRQYQEKTRELSALADQVDELKLQWSAPKLAELETQYQSAQTMLFENPDATADWAKNLKLQTARLGLETAIQLGAPQPCPAAAQTLAVTRASLDILPARAVVGTTNTPYQRLLELANNVATADKRIDLLELSVSGDSNSVQRASLVVQLWSPERNAK